MTSRIRILITTLVVCHQLGAPRLVTSEATGGRHKAQGARLQASGSGQEGAQATGVAHGSETRATQTQEVTIKAETQEKQGPIYRLRGNVEISYGRLVLHADEVTYNDDTGEATATGNLHLDGGPHDEHLQASHGSYNVRNATGEFFDVTGTIGARFRGSHVVLTSSTPFFFRGQRVEKTGPGRYVVHHGEVTSCEMPHPKWVFNAEQASVEVGGDARLYHTTFRLMGVPVFYFPFVQHPVEKLGRQTGFLIPSLGQSSRKGTILGEAFYWAINRSMDATIGAEYFSHRGWAQHGEFRARPSDNSSFAVRYNGVLDRGAGNPKTDQGGEEVTLNGQALLGHGVRAVADLDYLSSFVYRLAWGESFSQAVNSEVRSNAFLSKAADGFYFNLLGSRYQNFQSTKRGDLITILHAPGLDLSSVEQRLGKAPVYWSYDVALQGVSRREPDFVTEALVGRFDLEPRVAIPLVLGGWSVRPEFALRDTYYTQGRVPLGGVGLPGSQGVNRRAFETSMELRPPALSRIFKRTILDHTIKHVIEPRVTYRYLTGIDNFSDIIRFDSRDILSNTNEVEYALVQRIFAKRAKPGPECKPEPESPEEGATPTALNCQPGPAAARDVITWELAQKAFFNQDFGGALVSGQRNVLTTTAEFSGIAFLTEARRFSPIRSRLRINTSSNTDVQWELDYDTKKGYINSSTAVVNYHLGQFFVGGSHAYLQVPGEVFTSTPVAAPNVFNQFRWLVGYGNPNKKGISAAANIGFDVNSRFLQYSAFQTSYNWGCCGFSFEYRRFALGSVRNENQFRFALSLTNVGTFGTLRRQERLF